jgi:hypothetical protein
MERKFIRFVMLVLLVVLTNIPGVDALERMNSSEMKMITAQGGISIAVDGLLVTSETIGLSFMGLDTMDASGNSIDDGYIIGNTRSLFIADTGFTLDIGSIHGPGDLVFDGSSPDIPGINVTQIYGETSLDFEYNDIHVWNYQQAVQGETHLGSLSVDNYTTSHTKLKLFTPMDDICGFRGLAEARSSMDTFSFSAQEGNDDLVVTGVMKGFAFTGDPLPDDNLGTEPINTASWEFDGDGFRIGIPHYTDDPTGTESYENETLPFSIDISGGPRYVYTTGATITTPHMVIDAPMVGSIRIKSVASMGFDFGPVAMDGIKLYKNIIEFPGRGIGH